MKELRCVYGMAEVFERPGLSTDEILQGIVDLLPAAWQYPEVTCARMMTAVAAHGASGRDLLA